LAMSINWAEYKPLARYMARRLGAIAVMYFVTLTILFVLPRLIPANPAASYVESIVESYGGVVDPTVIHEQERIILEEFGYGKPLHVQYVDFITKAFGGDLGTSIAFYPDKVIDHVMHALPWTLFLFVPSTIIGWYIGNMWGAISGYRRGTTFEKVSVVVASTVAQIPGYWLAMLLILVFAVQLKLLPPGGAYSTEMMPSLTPQFVLSVLKHYILPFTALTLPYLCSQVITMRNLIIYELRSDYTMFGDYIGLPDKVIRGYAFRNAVMPQVVGLSIRLGRTVAGAALVETIFGYPGMGTLIYTAVRESDYMLLQGIFVILVATVYMALFLSDLVHVIIDPRVRLGYRKD